MNVMKYLKPTCVFICIGPHILECMSCSISMDLCDSTLENFILHYFSSIQGLQKNVSCRENSSIPFDID